MALGGTINVDSAAANFVTLQPTTAAQPINFDCLVELPVSMQAERPW